MDLYPANAQDMQDPLLALLEDYNKGDLEKQVPPAQSGPQPGKAGRDRPIVIMLDPATVAKTPVRWGNTKRAKRRGIANSSPSALSDRERGNMKVYMTRNEDIFIPLQAKCARVAKKPRNSVLTCLSLSMPTPLPVVSRAVPLCLRSQPKATSTAAKYLAQTQNASDLIGGVSKSGDRYVDHTMFDMVQSTIADSLKFGKAVLNKLGKINKLHKKSGC